MNEVNVDIEPEKLNSYVKQKGSARASHCLLYLHFV